MHAGFEIVWIADRCRNEGRVGSEFDGHSLKVTGAVSNSSGNTVPDSELLYHLPSAVHSVRLQRVLQANNDLPMWIYVRIARVVLEAINQRVTRYPPVLV